MRPPRPPRPPRDRQRGNSLVLALIVLSALATLAGLTVVSVQSGLKTSTHDRSQAIATYAAESGAAVAMDFLRNHFHNDTAQPLGWSAYVKPRNESVVPVDPADIPSNDALPGTPNNLFSPDQNAWFDIQLLNNRDDPGFAVSPPPPGGNDQDGRIIIRTTGHGPQGSVAIVEWEILRAGGPVSDPPPPLPYPLTPPPWDLSFTPPQGMVLLGWHVVSLQL